MTDNTLREKIEQELVWDLRVHPKRIGVSVHDGGVTLTGYVSTCSERRAALRAAERVRGVRAVADEIEVRLPASDVAHDADIAEAIAHTLQWNTDVPDTIKAEVRDGWVTLLGDADWDYERHEAERAIFNLRGVTGVTNEIEVRPKVDAAHVEQRIGEALLRNAGLDARSISITTNDGEITLHGVVRSFHERKAAERAARAAPGVARVHNRITVRP